MRKRKSSPEKIAANRGNALQSTGPKTPEGKRNSSRNASTHGAYANIRYEEVPEFTELLTAFRSEYRPISPTEDALVDHLAQAQFDIQRFRNLEINLFHDGIDSEDRSSVSLFNHLQRSLNAAHRRFLRSFETLRKLQSERPYRAPVEEQKAKPGTHALSHPAQGENLETKPNTHLNQSEITYSVDGPTIEDAIQAAGIRLMNTVGDISTIKIIEADCYVEGCGSTRGEQLRNWLTDLMRQMATRNIAMKTTDRIIVEPMQISSLAAGMRRNPQVHRLRTPISRVTHADLYPDEGRWIAKVSLER